MKDFPGTACTKELFRCSSQGPFLLSSEESCNATPVNHPLLPLPSPVALASRPFSCIVTASQKYPTKTQLALILLEFCGKVHLYLPYPSLPPPLFVFSGRLKVTGLQDDSSKYNPSLVCLRNNRSGSTPRPKVTCLSFSSYLVCFSPLHLAAP